MNRPLINTSPFLSPQLFLFASVQLSNHKKTKFKVCNSVLHHHSTIQINHQPDATVFQFIILTFIYSSTPPVKIGVLLLKLVCYTYELTTLETKYCCFSYMHFVLICTVVVLYCFVVCVCVRVCACVYEWVL